jgi:hypothetical protein
VSCLSNLDIKLQLLSSLKQLRNAIAGLSALAHPVINALTVYAQTLFLAASNRVKETNTLNETAVTRFTAVSDCQMVERALLRAATSQTDCYHFDKYPVLLYELCTILIRLLAADEKTHTRKGRYSMRKKRQ